MTNVPAFEIFKDQICSSSPWTKHIKCFISKYNLGFYYNQMQLLIKISYPGGAPMNLDTEELFYCIFHLLKIIPPLSLL